MHNFREDAKDWIILFGKDATDEEIKRLCRGRCAIEGHPSEGGVPFAQVHGKDVLEAVLAEGAGGVQLVEPDEEDALIPELDVADQEVKAAESASWGLDYVGVPQRAAAGRGVHIYVQDTGVRVSHRDFGGRAVAAVDWTSGSLVECNGDSACARDGQGHGTHVAGTAGGETYGVASQANIHAIKTLADSGTGQRAWNIGSIDFVAARGQKPAVINLSLGGKGQDQLYVVAIDAASARGVTVVVAAGNFGSDACTYSPAFVPSAITVGATEGDARAGYSNFGSCNDIMAPGSAITSAGHSSNTESKRLTGTSMACPHVAGGAAVLLSQMPWHNRDSIMAHMESYGRKGYVQNLKGGDPDLFLWVGADPAPSKPQCKDGSEPNYWGDCRCPGSQFCSLDGANRNCPTAMGPGGWGGNHYEWACTACQCY